MNIIRNLLTKGTRQGRPETPLNPKGIVVHYVANPNSSAQANRNYFENGSGGRGVSAHYIIGLDGEIIQCIPENEVAYHATTANSTHIGIECCHPDASGKFNAKTYGSLINLVVDICKRYKLEPFKDVIRHYDVSKKSCPLYYVNNESAWSEFLSEVNMKLRFNNISYRVRKSALDAKTQIGAFSVLDNAKRLADSKKTEGYKVFDMANNLIYDPKNVKQDTPMETATKILEMVKLDSLRNGLFPSVKAAQMILESNFLKSELAVNANNCFGMKKVLSGNTWANSTWNGSSVYIQQTKEQKVDGTEYVINAEFRKYDSIDDSIADHSAYLLGAKNGDRLRYEGINKASNYKEQIIIIKDGGYATDVNYISKLCNVIEKYSLDIYDNEIDTTPKESEHHKTPKEMLDTLIKGSAINTPEYWYNTLRDYNYFDGFIKALYEKYEKKSTKIKSLDCNA